MIMEVLRIGRVVVLLIAVALTSGCYYVQAAQGQWALSRSAEPVTELLADTSTPDALRGRLALSQEALRFAHDELGLPDNGSYRRYAALDRASVVTNVFAAPAFSLQPHTWCYPFVGCLAYRGYFDPVDAERYADKLGTRGFDVHVAGTAAYSTLGRLKDPLLSTMFRRSDDGLVSLLFHELAHQVIYVDNDTAFNESFASAVAAEGLRRWRAARGQAPLPPSSARRERQTQMRAAIVALREALRELYASGQEQAQMAEAKQLLFERLAQRWRESQWPGRPPANNAALIPMQLYDDLAPAFTRMLEVECDGNLTCLYDRVRELGAMAPEQRQALLASKLPAQ